MCPRASRCCWPPTAPSRRPVPSRWRGRSTTRRRGREPLIAGGALVFLVGIGLVISGLVAHRRSRGPRRNLPKGPKGKLTRAPGRRRSQQRPPRAQARVARSAQRRALVAPLLLVPAARARRAPPTTGRSRAGPDDRARDADATGEPGDETESPRSPRWCPRSRCRRWSASCAASRSSRPRSTRPATPSASPERFTGPALEARKANYVIRGSIAEHPRCRPSRRRPSPHAAAAGHRMAAHRAHDRQEQRRRDGRSDRLVLRRGRRARTTRCSTRPRSCPTPMCPRSLRPASALPINPEFKGLVMPTGQVARPTPTCCSRATSRSTRRCSTPRAT